MHFFFISNSSKSVCFNFSHSITLLLGGREKATFSYERFLIVFSYEWPSMREKSSPPTLAFHQTFMPPLVTEEGATKQRIRDGKALIRTQLRELSPEFFTL